MILSASRYGLEGHKSQYRELIASTYKEIANK
jgi:hypothetical protein